MSALTELLQTALLLLALAQNSGLPAELRTHAISVAEKTISSATTSLTNVDVSAKQAESLSGSNSTTRSTSLSKTVTLNGYPQSQVTTQSLSSADFQAILEERGTQSPYHVVSQLKIGGETADVLKVVETTVSGYRYLGVYHHIAGTLFNAYLAYSNDLKTWTKIGTIGTAAGMPDIRILPDNSVLYAHERNPSGNRPFIEVRYYTSVEAFIAKPGEPARSFSVPTTANATADGTPEFGTITYAGDISSSRIEITYHYYHNSTVDLQAKGTLTNFSTWSGATDSTVNNGLSALGYTDIGGREYFKIGSTVYQLVEANTSAPYSTGWERWRLFLINKSTGEIRKLAPQIQGGAISLGNPQVSFVTLPDGRPGVVLSYFVFSEGASKTPPGPHVYVYPLSSSESSQCQLLPEETRTRSCQAGYGGLITETRSSSCGANATSPSWNAWVETANTCVPNEKVYEMEATSYHGTGQKTSDGWRVTGGQHSPGYIQYGPYATDWGSGTVTATYALRLEASSGTPDPLLNLDIYDSTSGEILAERQLVASDFSGNTTTSFPMTFSLAGRSGHALEVRAWWYGFGTVVSDRVTVTFSP